MGAILTLLGGVRGIAMIALIVAALGWVAVQHQRLSQAQLARDQAILVTRPRDLAQWLGFVCRCSDDGE